MRSAARGLRRAACRNVLRTDSHIYVELSSINSWMCVWTPLKDVLIWKFFGVRFAASPSCMCVISKMTCCHQEIMLNHRLGKMLSSPVPPCCKTGPESLTLCREIMGWKQRAGVPWRSPCSRCFEKVNHFLISQSVLLSLQCYCYNSGYCCFSVEISFGIPAEWIEGKGDVEPEAERPGVVVEQLQCSI